MSLVDVIASLGAIVYSTPVSPDLPPVRRRLIISRSCSSWSYSVSRFTTSLACEHRLVRSSPCLTFSLGKMRADLRRIESKASSPLISLYNDAIDGVVMIRA